MKQSFKKIIYTLTSYQWLSTLTYEKNTYLFEVLSLWKKWCQSEISLHFGEVTCNLQIAKKNDFSASSCFIFTFISSSVEFIEYFLCFSLVHLMICLSLTDRSSAMSLLS